MATKKFTEDLTRQNKIDLINRYTREQSKDPTPTEIINLFYDYYEESTYWRIDEELLSKMLKAENGEDFISPKFSTYRNTNIQWNLQCCPNGWRTKTEGRFNYWIVINPWPKNIKSITTVCKLVLSHNNGIIRIRKQANIFKADDPSLSNRPNLILSYMKSMNHKSLEIEGFMDIIAIEFYDKDDYDIIDYFGLPDSVQDKILMIDGGIEKLNSINLESIVDSNDNVDDAYNDLLAQLPFDEEINSEIAKWNKDYFVEEYNKRSLYKYPMKLQPDEFVDDYIDIDTELAYEWTVTDEMLIEWKNAGCGRVFYSNTFGKGGNWSLFIAPNGDKMKRKDNVVLAISLLRANDGINHTVMCRYKFRMILDGKEISFEEPAELAINQSFWYWPENTLLNDKLQNISKIEIYVQIWDIGPKENNQFMSDSDNEFELS